MDMEINGNRLMAALQHVQRSDGHLLPQWRSGEGRGFTYFPGFDSDAAEQMTRDLEHLAGSDYLDKMFFDRLTICPSCGSHQVNVRESCTSCASAHISSVTLLHHFRCGYVAPAESFPKDGRGRSCPKCHGRLEHLGTDHDVPGDNFLCHACHASFQVPDVEGLCMSCQTRVPGAQLLHRDIFSYRLNSMGLAALTSGRLFEREEEQLLEGGGLPVYRRHVFMAMLEDEKRRAVRYGTPYSVVSVRLASTAVAEVERVVFVIAGSLRESDKIGRHDPSHLLVLLPSTDSGGAAIWLKRFEETVASGGGDGSVRAGVLPLTLEADPSGQIAASLEQVWTA